MERIDLHTHSNTSDGSLTPTEVVKAAKDQKFEFIIFNSRLFDDK